MIQLRKFDTGRLFMRVWPAAAVALCGVAVGAVGALADVASAPAIQKAVLARKLTADELQARALEAQIFVAQQQANAMQQGGLIRTAGLFGESDDEKAARLAHEQSQDTSIGQLNQRVGDLEDSLRRLTGQMEQLDHKLNDINAHIDRMQKDFDYKICAMTAQQLGTDQASLPCGGAGSPPPAQGNNNPPPPPSPASGPNAPHNLAPPPGVLGQIPSNTPMPIPPPAGVSDGSAPPAPPPAASPNRAQYDAAMNQLSKSQYDEAAAAFRAFADANPQDAMTPNAVYWIGAIAYVRKDYPGAARAFVEEIKKYGTAPRAPDSMLKLGQSLIAMGQKPQGCTTLEALPGKYPQASPNILGQAKAARKTAGCK
jgi:tol-pal system protein YbgF